MSVGIELGTEHSVKVTTLTDTNLYHFLHDSEVIRLAEGDRPSMLDIFYGAMGVLVGVIPGLPGVLPSLMRGSVDVPGVMMLMLSAGSLAVMAVAGPAGFKARRRVSDQLATIRNRPRVPVSSIPDLDYRRG